MTAIQILHETIKSKLNNRTTDELISDAKVARENKSDENSRMVFALIMDVISERVSESEFDTLYENLTK